MTTEVLASAAPITLTLLVAVPQIPRFAGAGAKERKRGEVKAGAAPKLVHVESVPGWTSDSIREIERGNLERDEEKYYLCCGCELRGIFIKGNITHTYFTAATPLGYSPFHLKWRRSEAQSFKIQQMVSQARRQTAEGLTHSAPVKQTQGSIRASGQEAH